MELTLNLSISRKTRKLLGLLAAVIIMTAVFFATIWFLNRGEQAIQGLSIGSVSVSKLPYSEAEARLKSVTENYVSSEITLKTPDGLEIVSTPQNVGIRLEIEKTVENAYSRGREGSAYKKLYEQAKSLFVGLEEPVITHIDNERFNGFVEFSLSEVHKPAQNASFEFNDETEEFEFVPSKMGIVVDINNLRQQIFESGQKLNLDNIQLIQNTDSPLVDSEEASLNAKVQAEEILSFMPYAVKGQDGSSWEIEKEDLVSWIEFVPVEKNGSYELAAEISEKAIQDYLAPFAPGLTTKPVNAAFEVRNGKVEAFSLAKPGLELNMEESAKNIRELLDKGEAEGLLAFNTTDPEITSESIDNLNITALIGRGESDFTGSPNNRRHNINVGAEKYHGILIEPGEEFSFNQNLGPVTASAGYLPELVIKQGATIPEYGGGLCQVSTTLFRAAVYSGLKITERYNHSYPVVYYGKPGFDATIYPDHPDLRFTNNTPGHILIQTQIVGSKLIFEIYGQDDGRHTEIDGPYTYDARSNGAVKAWVTQTVYDKNDNIMLEKTFYSNYRSPSLYPVNRNPLE
ncbi:MAG: VanW family protein [Candidatus Spechtbacterales bacterium]